MTAAHLFYPPKEIARTIIALHFEKTDMVQKIIYYGLQDGRVIDLQTRVTPTRGRELTILSQIFSNLGRFNKQDERNSSGPIPGRR
jgi:outer membrane protein assembly factor BamE (lipoprotein component of BamABCDE complex)